MCETAQGCLQPPDDDGHVAIRLADAVAVDDSRAIGAQSRLPAGRVKIPAALLFGGGVVGHHRVDIAGCHKKSQPRAAVGTEGIAGLVIGLCKDGNAIARVLKHAGNDGNTKGRMIHIGIARDVNKIRRIPAACLHLGTGEGKKL